MTERILCFAGLGNPGPEYANNRHNIGRHHLRFLMEKWQVVGAGKKSDCDLWRAERGRCDVLFAFPRTYMNLSGPPLAGLINALDIPPEHLMLFHDELDLPLYRLQIKRGGTSAGHRGVESVYQALGSQDCWRLRIGVGRPPGAKAARDFVLSDVAPAEMEEFGRIFERSIDGLEDWIGGREARAAQRINTDPASAPEDIP